jgi:hypothetical protein
MFDAPESRPATALAAGDARRPLPKGHSHKGLSGPASRGLAELEQLVASVVASWQASPCLLDSRRWHRVGYCRPVVLTPLADECAREGTSWSITGKDISLGGFSFLHIRPLPHRFVAVTFVAGVATPVTLLVRLTWCRFTRESRYQSGGSFVREIVLDRAPADDWLRLPQA